MDSVQSKTDIEKTSIDTVNNFLENRSNNEKCDKNNWRHLTKSDSCSDSLSSELSTNICEIDENFNVLNTIAEKFEVLEIDPEIIKVTANSLESRDESGPEENHPDLEDLRMDSNSGENCNIQQLAGRIDSVVLSMGIALVKPAADKNFLDIETPLFLCTEKLPAPNSVASDCVLVGHIDDIFGPVRDPMYSVLLEADVYELLQAETEIYYVKSHPSTSFIHVQERTDKSFRVIRKKNRQFCN